MQHVRQRSFGVVVWVFVIAASPGPVRTRNAVRRGKEKKKKSVERRSYLRVQVEVRLGVDAEMLAEQRGEVQDPLVNLDDFVRRQRRGGVGAAGSGVGAAGSGVGVGGAVGGVTRCDRGVLDEGEPDHRQVVQRGCRLPRLRRLFGVGGDDGFGEVGARVERLRVPVRVGEPHGERALVGELALQRGHQVLVRDHRGHDHHAHVRAARSLDGDGRAPLLLVLALAQRLRLARLRGFALGELRGGEGFRRFLRLLGREAQAAEPGGPARGLRVGGRQHGLGGVDGSARVVILRLGGGGGGGVRLGFLVLAEQLVRLGAVQQSGGVRGPALQRARRLDDHVRVLFRVKEARRTLAVHLARARVVGRHELQRLVKRRRGFHGEALREERVRLICARRGVVSRDERVEVSREVHVGSADDSSGKGWEERGARGGEGRKSERPRDDSPRKRSGGWRADRKSPRIIPRGPGSDAPLSSIARCAKMASSSSALTSFLALPMVLAGSVSWEGADGGVSDAWAAVGHAFFDKARQPEP